MVIPRAPVAASEACCKRAQTVYRAIKLIVAGVSGIEPQIAGVTRAGGKHAAGKHMYACLQRFLEQHPRVSTPGQANPERTAAGGDIYPAIINCGTDAVVMLLICLSSRMRW